ncbi:hypothetical protein QBC38DRAFT_449071 [Podospora fimiseda]|uniref:Nephrocystin 3-like N-terminal domain-containing protein n=1 Tax=Podospora fimiseda TaxID=252190 RepID=A0AAN6YN30_9PEZI|nr:hypothetical protein QBC38DRAFT_449071 [Podospora fimiseda]
MTIDMTTVPHYQVWKGLRYEDINQRRSEIRVKHPGTFEWVHTSSFRQWLTSEDEPIFWIIGKPGSGKSTLMISLVHSDQTLVLAHHYPQRHILSHFFSADGGDLECNIKGLLCDLVSQLLSIPQHGIVFGFRHEVYLKENERDWAVAELCALLLQLLPAFVTVCIFLDGLDEIDPTDGPPALFDLLEKLKQYQKSKYAYQIDLNRNFTTQFPATLICASRTLSTTI